ncbi:glucose repression mediator protein [Basidiobolus ranarum]|uniref:Glucose repression mediator protein n=1 Tax=Basidiobolus ranarum TaxID=34480 RepID=A0ABR2WSZ4_9FUNG
MAQQKYNKAYEAYQQAVYRDGRNPTFWCSIGVLYYQIHQYRDALDAYSRAIRLNPYISEVWYDLGTLYESCNNQINDAIDAYQRAAELDPNNPHIKQRLLLLRNAQTAGSQPTAPIPQDVNLSTYQNNSNFPSQFQQGGATQGPPQGFPGYPPRSSGEMRPGNPPPMPHISNDRPGPPPPHEFSGYGRRSPPPLDHPPAIREEDGRMGEYPGARGPYGGGDSRPPYPPHMSPNPPISRPSQVESPHHSKDVRMPPASEMNSAYGRQSDNLPSIIGEKREIDDAARMSNGISNYHNNDNPVSNEPSSRPNDANLGDRRIQSMHSPINHNRPKPETYSPSSQNFKYEPYDNKSPNIPANGKDSRKGIPDVRNDDVKSESRNIEGKPGARSESANETGGNTTYESTKPLDEDYDGADALMSMMSMRSGKESGAVSQEPERLQSNETKRSHTMPPLPTNDDSSKTSSVSPHLAHSQNHRAGARAGSVPTENTGVNLSTQSSPQLPTQSPQQPKKQA